MKYLKHFETSAQYDAFKDSEEFILPNVTYVVENSNVYYQPYVEPVSPNYVLTFDVQNISQETKILHDYALSAFSSMIVDGVEMPVDCYYQFDTIGLHTVEFIFAEGSDWQGYDYNTALGEGWFRMGESVEFIKIEIPSSVTRMYNYSLFAPNLKEIVLHCTDILYRNDTPDAWADVLGASPTNYNPLPNIGVLKFPKNALYGNALTEYMNKNYPNWKIERF